MNQNKLVCSKCHSEDISAKVWVKVNDNGFPEIILDILTHDEMWCEKCKSTTTFIKKEKK